MSAALGGEPSVAGTQGAGVPTELQPLLSHDAADIYRVQVDTSNPLGKQTDQRRRSLTAAKTYAALERVLETIDVRDPAAVAELNESLQQTELPENARRMLFDMLRLRVVASSGSDPASTPTPVSSATPAQLGRSDEGDETARTYRQLARNLYPNNLAQEDPEADQIVVATPPKAFAASYKAALRSAEFQLASRVSFRVNELQNLSSRVALDHQVQALKELHMLRLKDFQSAMRADLERFMHHNTTPITAYRRGTLWRNRRVFMRDAALTAKEERFKQEREREAEKERHRSQLDILMDHRRKFLAFHANVRTRLSALVADADKAVKAKDRRAQLERERLEKERLRLLMDQDTEGYLRLLDEQKDSRKRILLDKIDERMRVVNKLIDAHQQQERARDEGQVSDAATLAAAAESSNAGASEEVKAGAEAALKAKFDAHVVQEDIEEQPTILVGGKLKPYQMYGLRWLVSLYNNRINGILADEMGLGKTIQTIALLTYLVEKKNNSGPFLVIVPLATLSNWRLELAKWAPSLVTVAYRGNKVERRVFHQQIKDVRFNVLLTTYEMIIKDRALLSKACFNISWRYMIIDEGHRMKNSKNKLSQTLMHYFSAPRRLLLTGTPLQNSLPELWSLLNFILPDVFNSSDTFDSWFSAPFAETSENVELDAEEKQLIILQLHKILRPFLLRRLKKEVETQLPDKVEHVIKCEMSALQRKLYVCMQKYGVIPSSTQSTSGSNMEALDATKARSLQNVVMQMRKLCCHPFLFKEVEQDLKSELLRHEDAATALANLNGLELWRTAGKLELLDHMIPKLRRFGHRILLFSQFTTMLDILEDYFRYRRLKYCRMDGTCGAAKRAELLHDFNAPDSDLEIFILSTRAGGLGLNLQTADTVVIFDSDWNPHQDLQAQDRAHRIGQTKEVRVFRLVTVQSVEERMLERAREKLDVDQQVIQAGKFNQTADENDTKKMLLEIIQQANDDDDEIEAGVTDHEDLNRMLARSDEELEAFVQMDEEIANNDQAWHSDRRQTRLFARDELPAGLIDAENSVAKAIEEAAQEKPMEDYGRGARVRKEVNYAEDLTELQFLKAVESGSLDEARERSAAKRKHRSRSGGAKADGKTTATSEGEQTALELALGVLYILLRIKLCVLYTSERAQGRFALISGDADVTAAENIINDLLSSTNRHGHVLSSSLMDLPSRAEEPGFYKRVRKPISLRDIQTKAMDQAYDSLDDLEADVDLLVDNVIDYYDDGEAIVDDAEQLRATFLSLRQREEDDSELTPKAAKTSSRGRTPGSRRR
ncbi:uncharacterized protein MONBRDRAFT_29199 [Monosiga brevicollis MX1]|uniref:Uncharacterized protein n=1 Tax=Monosiga brevicollis TaxID=81824 RepID=A9VAE6_MONBE|nr:uncharacterized protein MONBRDRAFT_29199 [Monosiga brevicollis MX1]EDQ85471.1 predicted protein [Monosiga brevicollis MX1]|eukprot:XP_001749662.1 hypothetical protein [Monosiga brevicollis MX1]